jgi:hypothetical protein
MAIMHCIHVRIADRNTSDAPAKSQALGFLYAASGVESLMTSLKSSVTVSCTVKVQLLPHPAVPLPGISHLREMTAYVHTKICAQVFAAPLLVVV